MPGRRDLGARGSCEFHQSMATRYKARIAALPRRAGNPGVSGGLLPHGALGAAPEERGEEAAARLGPLLGLLRLRVPGLVGRARAPPGFHDGALLRPPVRLLRGLFAPGHLGAGLDEVPGLARGLRPVEHAVVDEALAHEEVLEESPQVRVVRPVLEAQRAAIVQVGGEDCRVALAEGLHGRRALALHDLVVLLLLGVGLKTLPWKLPTIEVHQHIPYGFQVVPTTLLNAKVRVDGGVAGSACQALVFPVRYVLLRFWVPVLLCQPKVDHIYDVRLLLMADEEVVRFDVPVNEVLGVKILNPKEHLVRNHEDCLQAKLSVTYCEDVLK
mmetsp:Transcript_91013/g.257707  ORF Transcript_91013/g.257707 Transcript_91013/m.257707 type:complete len:328 (-) Transcript_91013:336-1319(-)